jgi:hypothetical protein
MDTGNKTVTIEEYKAQYPRESVFVQVDDSERIMTPEEYETWVSDCVYNMNHDPLAP